MNSQIVQGINDNIDKFEDIFDEKDIMDLIKGNYDYEKIKKIIVAKIDFYFNKNYYKIKNEYDQKLENLLENLENLFVKNEMIKQKIIVLRNYLNSLNIQEKK